MSGRTSATTISSETPTSHDSTAHRPVTSKPRGICQYYKTDRGCYAGDRCKFLHGETERLTPYDKSKVCKFHAAGYCRRGEKCWFSHADPTKVDSTSESDEDEEAESVCSICYDKPATFGLLAGCSHVFCITCIKNWRETQGKSDDIVQAGTTKTCPMCRTSSRFVTPSAFFYAEGHPMKTEVIEKYKASMARVKCRYFERSKPNERYCPFGKECFYKHENSDGTPYVFERGAAYYMERGRSRLSRGGFGDDTWSIDVEEHVEIMLNTISQVFGTSREMQRAILESVAAEFGIESLPPMYRLDEEDEEPAEASASPSETFGRSEETGNDSPGASTTAPSLWINDEETPESPEENEEGSTPALPDQESPVPTRRFTSNSTLDPTIPEFVPSFQRSGTSQVAGPSYELDWLRPLPSGPDVASGSRLVDQLGSGERELEPATHSQPWRAHPSMSIDDLLNRIDDFAARRLEEPSPPSPPFDVSTLLLNHPSPETPSPPTTDSAPDTPIATRPSASEPALVQDADPPFMTDGRGRVVWSSTTSSRGREGRRGRAASSSATVLPHSKSTPDVLVPEDRAAPSRHDSPAQRTSQRLIRQRSLPSVGPSSEVEEVEVRPAEFVTDGRGRVVSAAGSPDH